MAELIATGLRRRDGIALEAWQEASLVDFENVRVLTTYSN